MGYKNFRVHCTLRVIGLSAALYGFLLVLKQPSLWMVSTLMGFIVISMLVSLIRYVEKTNRDLKRFLEAMKYEDFSQSFSSDGRGKSFDALKTAFSNVTREIRRARSEREEHYRYLQTVVQHVGIGVISYGEDGEVELFNDTAKRLLGVAQLKNVRSLKQYSPMLAETLLGMQSNDRALIPVKRKGEPLQLAVSAAEFRMRGRRFRLVSLQDIRNEIERERMAKELEIAYQVQTRLLPERSPVLSGFDISGICIPAEEVGGDYYDYIDLGDGKLGIAVGDVSGKGVPAAIYMTLAKGVVNSQAEEVTSPGNLLAKVNNLMFESIDRGAFVSMIFAVLDSRAKTLTFSRAGHNPVLFYRKKAKTLSWIQPEGIALGLERGKVFLDVIEDKRITLEKGDSVILYTDGFVEAMNRDHIEYGEDRLLQSIQKNIHLSSKELIDTVCREVKGFADDHPQHDDMTMVSVKAI